MGQGKHLIVKFEQLNQYSTGHSLWLSNKCVQRTRCTHGVTFRLNDGVGFSAIWLTSFSLMCVFNSCLCREARITMPLVGLYLCVSAADFAAVNKKNWTGSCKCSSAFLTFCQNWQCQFGSAERPAVCLYPIFAKPFKILIESVLKFKLNLQLFGS